MECSSEKLQNIVAAAVSETLENMAFMIVESAPEQAAAAEAEEPIRAALLICAPQPGEMRLLMPRKTAAALAQALYNVAEAEITDAMLNDVTGELLNTIGGSIMQKLLPGECPFELGLPEIGPQAFLACDDPPLRCSFSVDGNPFEFMASMDLMLRLAADKKD